MKIILKKSNKMADLDVAFFYESLEVFLTRDYKLNKSIQIIPYYVIRSSNDVYAMLIVNSSQTVTDFSTDWGKNKSFQTYVADSIRSNSLGCINLYEDHILINSHIGYATAYNVSEGKQTLAEGEIPAVFVKIVVDTIDDLDDILFNFKDSYSKAVKRIIDGTFTVSNLVYMPVEDLYYISRFTTYKVRTPDGIITIDMDDEGFPAIPAITHIYSPILEDGDVPCGDKYNELGNCCPPVTFYTARSILLRKALLPLFSHGLPVMSLDV